MARLYRAPAEYPPPVFSPEDTGEAWKAKESAYLDKLKAVAIEQVRIMRPKADVSLIGKEIAFQRADGYARYMIWDTKPLTLIHLELLDAYSVEPALIRGLNLAEVAEMVAREERLQSFFATRADNAPEEDRA